MQWMICSSQQWISTLPKSRSPLPLWAAQEYFISWWANPVGSSWAVYAVTRVAVGVTGNWWVAPVLFSCEHSATASPLWHCQGITQERSDVYFWASIQIWYRGREGGSPDLQMKSCFSRFCHFPCSPVDIPRGFVSHAEQCPFASPQQGRSA